MGIGLILASLLSVAGGVFLARAARRRREDFRKSPEALEEHVRFLSGCTCPADGSLNLDAYYCPVHGDDVRSRVDQTGKVRVSVHRPSTVPCPVCRREAAVLEPLMGEPMCGSCISDRLGVSRGRVPVTPTPSGGTPFSQ